MVAQSPGAGPDSGAPRAARSAGLAVLVVILVLLGAAGAPRAGAQGGPPAQVLVVSSESLDLPSLALVDRGLRAAFGAAPAGRPDVYAEVLDTVRFPDAGFQREQADWLRRKYAGRRLDLIVALGAPALRLVAPPGGDPAARPFPGAPVVFGLVGPDQVAAAPAADVTGVWLTYDFAPTMEAILRLQPGAREVAVVVGSGSYDAYLTELARRQLAPYQDRVRFTYLNDLALPEQLARVAALPPDAAVFLLSMTRDVAGGQYVSAEAGARVAAAAGAPVYAPFDVYLGRGIVGGAVIHYELQGAEIAGLAGQVLAGAPAAALPPVRAGTNPYVFDWRQLRRWGLREARLPRGSEVRYKELSAWERYRAPIAGAAGLLALETALLATLLTERRGRRRAEAAERAAQGQREALARELTHVSRVAAVGELGASIAHELAQPLAAIRANTDAGRRFLAAPGPGGPDLAEVDAILADIADDDARATAVIGRLRALLRKGEVERAPLDLNAAVAETAGLVAPDAARRGVALSLDLEPDLPPVLGDRVQLQQVVLNLLLNGLDAAAPPPGPPGAGPSPGGRSPCGRGAGQTRRPQGGRRARPPRGGRWRWRCGTAGRGSTRRRPGACSSPSTPPSPPGWAWGWPSAAPSPRPTAAPCGPRTTPRAGRCSPSPSPSARPPTPPRTRGGRPPRASGSARSRVYRPSRLMGWKPNGQRRSTSSGRTSSPCRAACTSARSMERVFHRTTARRYASSSNTEAAARRRPRQWHTVASRPRPCPRPQGSWSRPRRGRCRGPPRTAACAPARAPSGARRSPRRAARRAGRRPRRCHLSPPTRR